MVNKMRWRCRAGWAAALSVFLFFPVLGAQTLRQPKNLSVKTEPLDTALQGVRSLGEVVVVGNFEPISFEEHWRMKYRVKKVWPYAVLAAQYLHQMDSLREDMSKRKFRKEVEMRQKQLFDNFSGILKKFTRSEGRILIKLVYRQTGISTYQIARELKSGFKAFWWNASAGLFSLSLKDEFAPWQNAEDYHIENVLQECFAENSLKRYPGYSDYTSPFYYRKVEQSIERDRRESEENRKAEKERERELRKRERQERKENR